MSSKILGHSALNAVAGIVQLGAGFVCSIVVARLLGAEAVGVVAVSLWMVTTAIAVADGGISIALRRFVPSLSDGPTRWSEARAFGAYLLRPYIVAVAALALLHLALVEWGFYAQVTFEDGRTILLTGLVFVVYAIGQYYASLLISAGRYGPLIRLTLVSAPLQIGCVWLGARLWGVDGALLGYVPAFLLFAVAAIPLLVGPRDRFGLAIGRLIRFSVVSWLSYTVQIVFLFRGEFVFLGALASHEAVGLYSAALSLTNIAIQLPLQAAGALIPFYAEKRLDVSADRPPPAFEATIRAMMLFSAPLCLGLAAIAPELMPAMFGEPFRAAGGILVVLGIGSLVFVFVSFANQLLYATEQSGFVLGVCVLGSAVMTAGCLLVIPAYGAIGAGYVRGLTYLAMAAVLFHRTKLARASATTWRALGLTLVAAIGCALVARLVVSWLGGWPGIALAVVVAALVYGAAIRWLRLLTSEDLDVLAGATERLPPFARRALRVFDGRGAGLRPQPAP